MAKKSVTFDVKVNTPSAQQEATRVANIFQTAFSKLQVSTKASASGGGGGGGGGSGSGGGSNMPGSSLRNLVFGSAQYALAGQFYSFYQNLPANIMNIDRMATANRRAAASFATIAGSADKANSLVDAYIRGTGNIATRGEAMTDAMKLFNLGLATTETQMQKFTTVSRGMSQATGRDVQYIQEQFSLAMANQSLLRFDQLGLSIQRHKEIMKDLQNQYPDMTREVAFQNAMLQQATEKYYDLATAQEALATSSEIVSRAARQAAEDIGLVIQERLINPRMAELARGLGQTDMGLFLPDLAARREAHQRDLFAREQRGGPGPSEYYEAAFHLQNPQDVYQRDMARLRTKIKAEDTMLGLGGKMSAAETMGVKIPDQWRDQFSRLNDAVANFGVITPQMTAQIDNLSTAVDFQVGILKDKADAEDAEADAVSGATAAIEDMVAGLHGIGTKLVDDLLERGFSPEKIRDMMPSEGDIQDLALLYQQQKMLQGDYVSQEIAKKYAEKTLYGGIQDTVESIDDAAKASEKASRAAESAAKKWETTVNTTADKLKSTFSSMLHSIPGLFGTSEVNEDDLYLASQGIPVNYADDPLRRLADVALNKTKRDDVDLGEWARALRLPEGTDPKALYILAKRAWESGELFANPENINKFVNKQAVGGDLMGQEFASLGQQALEAMFGIGTPEGTEYLRVFGIKALEPIQDGLITEITTKGPAMGSIIADAMYDGFQSQAMSLPWVSKLMEIMTGQVGRSIATEMNSNATSDLASSEAVPYTTPAGAGVLH